LEQGGEGGDLIGEAFFHGLELMHQVGVGGGGVNIR
jgi:hypothetical protein